jgi:hypothetical protein
VAAVDAIAAGESGVLIGLRDGVIAATPLAEVVGKTKIPEHALRSLVPLLD